MDISCPIRNFRIGYQEQPWLSHDLIGQIIEKNNALRLAKRTDSPLHWFLANELKNKCQTNVKNAKEVFVVEEVEAHKKDSKKFWASMKNLVPGKGKKSKQINLEKDGVCIPTKEVANHVNNFFAGIGPELEKQHTNIWEFSGTEAQTVMDDFYVNAQEVLKITMDISNSKSSSIDNISTKVFKASVRSLPEKLTKIFNLSILNSIVPVS